MLSALAEAQEADMFELVWQRMHTQFAVSPSSTDGVAAASSSSFHPSALMFLCRLSVLMSARRLDIMEDVFRAWKRAADATSHEVDPAARIAPPNLLAYHLLMRRHLLACEAAKSAAAAAAATAATQSSTLKDKAAASALANAATAAENECSSKCLKLLQEMKSSSSIDPDDGDDGGDPTYKKEQAAKAAAPSADAAAVRPVLLTYHLALQSLLPRASRDLRHLTSLLLDLEGAGLAPDWQTTLLSLQVCQRAVAQSRALGAQQSPAQQYGSSRASVKAVERERALAAETANSAWNKGAQLWSAAQSRAASAHQAATQKRAAALAAHRAADALGESGAARKDLPVVPPPLPPLSAMLPAPLYAKFLELCLAADKTEQIFDTLTIMRDTALEAASAAASGGDAAARVGLLLPPIDLIEPLLRQCVSAAGLSAPEAPSPTFPDGRPVDEDALALEGMAWTRRARAHQVLQRKALATALHLLRCSATHARMAAAAAPPSKNASIAPPSIPLSHYVPVFETLSLLGRVEEFTKLWQHFMAQPPTINLSDANATNATAAFIEVSRLLDELVRAALRLDSAALVDATLGLKPDNKTKQQQQQGCSDASKPDSTQDSSAVASTEGAATAVQTDVAATEVGETEEASKDATAAAEDATENDDSIPAVSTVGGELAYSMCTFFAQQQQQQQRVANSSSAPVVADAATERPPMDAPTEPQSETASKTATAAVEQEKPTDSGSVAAASSATASSPPAAACDSSSSSSSSAAAIPVDLLPAVSRLSATTRRALLASLLAGEDLSDEFTAVFNAVKRLPADVQGETLAAPTTKPKRTQAGPPSSRSKRA
jgi:hypothetical protein